MLFALLAIESVRVIDLINDYVGLVLLGRYGIGEVNLAFGEVARGALGGADLALDILWSCHALPCNINLQSLFRSLS